MKILRAIVVSLVVYLLTLVIGAAAALALGINMIPGSEVPAIMWYISAIASACLMAIGGWWFFRWKHTGPSLQNGTLLGITSVFVGFCMDALMLVSAGATGNLANNLLTYYMEPMFLLSVALIVATPAILGHTLGRR